MERARHLLRSSIIVILLFGLGKLTGLIRTRMVSSAFGTSPEFDAFTAANQLPEVFVTLISGGALAAAFIPVYSNYLTSERAKEGTRLASSVLTLVFIVLSTLSLTGIFFAHSITANLLVPEFPAELQQQTAQIMQIILIQTTLFGVSGVLSSILNAHQHFALPALAPVALDIGYMIGLFIFVPSMGIIGLAWGTVVGGILHIAIQLPALARFRFRYRPRLGLKMAGVQEVIRLMIPRIITLGSVQIADLFIIRLTSGLESGSTSGYFYGYYLMQLPETLIGTAIAIVVFPTMSELYNTGQIDRLVATSMAALRIIWTLAVPAAVLLVLLGRPAIVIFLEDGAFTETSTSIVYGVLLFFSIRVVAEASLEILARLFYAQHNTVIPMAVAIIWLTLNIRLAVLFVDKLGVQGLALASTIAFSIQVILLFILNRIRLGSLQERKLAGSAARSLIGALAMTIVILLTGQLFSSDLALLIIGGSLGLVTYFLTSLLLGSQELPTLIKLLRTTQEA